MLVLIGCGLVELALSLRGATDGSSGSGRCRSRPPVGGLPALVWVAFKVGALSYGGGFVIVPLMQADAVNRYHWLTSGQFLNAVALGQVTPGPVVHTVAAVGYGAHGLGGGLLAACIAFTPSFVFVLLGAGAFQRLRDSDRAKAFLGGAGPAAAGAILGTSVPLVSGTVRDVAVRSARGGRRAPARAPPRRGANPARRRGDRRGGRSRGRQPSA